MRLYKYIKHSILNSLQLVANTKEPIININTNCIIGDHSVNGIHIIVTPISIEISKVGKTSKTCS